jgi:glyoxylase-like metal-dependent hydrolase (beta-lactamase superfamily II)
MKLIDGVYAYPWTNMMENNCNTYVLQGPDGLILIDPGLGRYVPDTIESIKKDGLNPDDIKLVVCTHCHPDHVDGVAYFAEKNIPVTWSAEEDAFLNEIGRDFFRMFGLNEPGFKAKSLCKEGDLSAAGLTLQVILTPGHSPGSICLYWAEKQVMVTGDVVFSSSIGRTDFPGGDSPTLKKSIDRIAELPATLVLPGHNEVVEGAEAVKGNYDYIKKAFFSYL